MSTSSSLDPNLRDAQCVGEATDLVSFLQHVDKWLASVDVISLDFPLFRGQEVESWRLVPAIGRAPYQLRLRQSIEPTNDGNGSFRVVRGAPEWPFAVSYSS